MTVLLALSVWLSYMAGLAGFGAGPVLLVKGHPFIREFPISMDQAHARDRIDRPPLSTEFTS